MIIFKELKQSFFLKNFKEDLHKVSLVLLRPLSSPDSSASDLQVSTIWNLGGDIDSLLQRGQWPGVLRRVRFLNEKLHRLQWAGSMLSRLGRKDLVTCCRWSRASFSFIPKSCESSLRSRHSLSSASAILCLMVTDPSIQSPFSLLSLKINFLIDV